MISFTTWHQYHNDSKNKKYLAGKGLTVWLSHLSITDQNGWASLYNLIFSAKEKKSEHSPQKVTNMQILYCHLFIIINIYRKYCRLTVLTLSSFRLQCMLTLDIFAYTKKVFCTLRWLVPWVITYEGLFSLNSSASKQIMADEWQPKCPRVINLSS